MQDIPGASCGCGDDIENRPGYCNRCGARKRWVSNGPHSQVFECPDCS